MEVLWLIMGIGGHYMLNYQLTNYLSRYELRDVIRQLRVHGGKEFEVRKNKQGYSVWVETPKLGEFYGEA